MYVEWGKKESGGSKKLEVASRGAAVLNLGGEVRAVQLGKDRCEEGP